MALVVASALAVPATAHAVVDDVLVQPPATAAETAPAPEAPAQGDQVLLSAPADSAPTAPATPAAPAEPATATPATAAPAAPATPVPATAAPAAPAATTGPAGATTPAATAATGATPATVPDLPLRPDAPASTRRADAADAADALKADTSAKPVVVVATTPVAAPAAPVPSAARPSRPVPRTSAAVAPAPTPRGRRVHSRAAPPFVGPSSDGLFATQTQSPVASQVARSSDFTPAPTPTRRATAQPARSSEAPPPEVRPAAPRGAGLLGLLATTGDADGGGTTLLDVLATYILPTANGPTSQTLLFLMQLAFILAMWLPPRPSGLWLSVATASGSRRPGFDPVALRPG